MSPVDGVFNVGGYDTARFGSGVVPRLPDGGVELARTNAIQEQWLRELEPDGSPAGWGTEAVAEDEGYDVFFGATRASMARYNISPIDPLDDAVQFNKAAVGGGSPPNRNTPDIALLAEDPYPPTVKKVDAAYVGYPQGEYLAAMTIVGRSGKTHTLLSPTVAFTVNTDGKALEWQASQDLPQEAYGEGLWLSAPADLGGTPDPSTMRLQRVRKRGPRTYKLRGPLKLGSHARKPPSKNETKIGTPKKLKRGHDFEIKGGMAKDLQPMRLRASIVTTTHEGESLPSEATDAITVNNIRKHHGWVFHPRKLHPDATGFKIFVMVDDVVSPVWYQVIRVPKGDKFRRFWRGAKPQVLGYIDSGSGSTTLPKMPSSPDQDSDDKKKKRDEKPNHYFYLLSQADPPTEDSTGIEDPTGDIDAPIPIGLGRPGAGAWWVSYCRRFNGKPTQASKPVKVNLPDTGGGATDKVIELRFPARVNKIFNALYGQLDQKGIPIGWTFKKQDFSVYTTKDAQMTVTAGVVKLRTSGAPSTGDRFPRATSYDPADVLNTATPTNRDRLERIRLTLEVTERVTGRGYVELVQFDDTGTETGAITLATLVQNGFLYVDKTLGDSTLLPDISITSGTDFLGIRWGIENGTDATRNLRVACYNIFLHPFDAKPRKFEERSGPDELWQPSIDPATPVPASHVLAIGPHPPSPGDIAAAPAPLNNVDHLTGTVVVGSGALPAGFTVTETTPGSNSQATIAATTAFTGVSQQAARFRSDNLSVSTQNYFQKDYSSGWTGASSLAMLFTLYIERLPSKDYS